MKSKRSTKPKLDPLLAEALGAASPERFGCQQCKLHETCETPFMRPYVPENWTGLLLLVGEAPGEDEDEHSGRPFTGRAGRLLRDLWRGAGFVDADVALVNANRCRPPHNATPTMSQVRACRGFVLHAIIRLKPRLVVALGGTALRSITNNSDANVTRARGRALAMPGLQISDPTPDGDQAVPSADGVSGAPAALPKIVVSYHPAAALYPGGAPLKDKILEDLRNARAERKLVEYPVDAEPNVDGRAVAVDTEWAPSGELLCAAVASSTAAVAENASSLCDVSQVGGALSYARTLVAHSAAGDVEKLVEGGLPVRERWAQGRDLLDSLLLARMVNENGQKGAYELEALLLDTVPVAPWKYRTKQYSETDASLWPEDLRLERCRLDAWASYLVAKDKVRHLSGCLPLVEFTHRVASTISRLSLVGACIDLDELGRQRGVVEAALLEARDKLTKAALATGMTEFVPTNDGHLREFLYERVGLEVKNRTKKERLPAVDKPSLILLDHDAARLIMDYSKQEKLWSTYIEGLGELITPGGMVGDSRAGRLEFHINPLAARTGRRSASAPNSQNWGKAIRGIVRSRWPLGRIGDFDYSKLEPIILAWTARDTNLYYAFTEWGGYAYFAKEMWGYACEEDTPEYRATKSIILGVHYNMQTPKMAQQLWMLYDAKTKSFPTRFSSHYKDHEAKTDKLRGKYLSLVPGVVAYMDRQERHLLATGTSVAADGAVRHLPIPDGRDTPGYGHLLNQAINFPIQRLASSISGAALIDIEEELLRLHRLSYVDYIRLLGENRRKVLTNGFESGIMYPMSMIFNEVHDAVVIDLHPDFIKRDSELAIETMRAVPSFRKLVPSFKLPLNVGSKIGTHWSLTNGI